MLPQYKDKKHVWHSGTAASLQTSMKSTGPSNPRDNRRRGGRALAHARRRLAHDNLEYADGMCACEILMGQQTRRCSLGRVCRANWIRGDT
ncbi:hypothetical protein EVAR_52726_1 [Eumeta japonica]|uniref:Uncharacterized protein n=1 Tax=Eumeta variegata TaxID=151549 RepID=A0A4C1ZEV5_EUMVA|nr:hypothetical protein EVAR_52726_1 [Eumeta japonica]